MKIKLIDIHYKDKFHPGDNLQVGKDIPKAEADYFISSKNAEILEETPAKSGGK